MKANNSDLQNFIKKNYNKSVTQLAFKKVLVEGYDNRFVLNQLHGKQKAKNKLPFLFNNNQILYPAKVSVEQSSSEKTAIWKANLVSGDTLLDMTGGFGVDTYHFAKQIKQVTYLEKNTELFEIVQHNFEVLNAENITAINDDSITFLKKTTQKFDWIYLDPARRDAAGSRKIGLAGYFPNLLDIKDLLFEKAKNILVKVSPMLDIQQAIQQVGIVQKVIVLAVQNEVKELLLVLTPPSSPLQTVMVDSEGDRILKGFKVNNHGRNPWENNKKASKNPERVELNTDPIPAAPQKRKAILESRVKNVNSIKKKAISFQCVNLQKEGSEIIYQSTNNRDNSALKYSLPKKYIYEPNAAILKAGLFAEIALDFNLSKLHPNTHLYTSEQLITDFPGRTFTCIAIENFNKKAIAPHLENKKANITTRNFPYSVAQIKKKLGIKDGGNIYLFATTLMDEKLAILVCGKG